MKLLKCGKDMNIAEASIRILVAIIFVIPVVIATVLSVVRVSDRPLKVLASIADNFNETFNI